jgi:DNA-binding GntR family transcriptional regulator
MEFREATDELLSRISHEQLAETLGVSVAAVRQARLAQSANAHRPPPKDWRFAVIRLAEQQIMRNRELIERVRGGAQSA